MTTIDTAADTILAIDLRKCKRVVGIYRSADDRRLSKLEVVA